MLACVFSPPPPLLSHTTSFFFGDMAIVEDVTESDNVAVEPLKPTELLDTLRGLSKRLALPEDLLPSFMNEDKRECSRLSGIIL